MSLVKPEGLNGINGMSNYENLRDKDTRWTPVNEEVLDILRRLHREGGSWTAVAMATTVKQRQIYRIRKGQQKCVSMKVLDRLLAKSSMSHSIRDFPWYTIEEIQEMGLWNQPLPHIKRRSDDGSRA